MSETDAPNLAEPDCAELERLLAAATKGPFDVGPCNIVRAVRGDLAVPMFEPRAIFHDPANPAPTVRYASSRKVQFRAGSEGARIAHYFKLEHANSALVVAALNTLPALLAERKALREALTTAEHKFRHYEDLHRLKCTADGDEKADRNREMADMCAAALKGASDAR